MNKPIAALILAFCLPMGAAVHAGNFLFVEEAGDLSGSLGKASAPNSLGPNARNPMPPAGYQEQLYTTPDMCTYSRAQAPGYAEHWYLVMNPHHIGMPNAHSGCPTRL